MKTFFCLVSMAFLFSCQNKPDAAKQKKEKTASERRNNEKTAETASENKTGLAEKKATSNITQQNYDSLYRSLPDSAFVELIKWDKSFVLDIRYATADNFMKEAVYECGKCFLRKKVAQDLIAAQKTLLPKGYRLKLFDCYRPRPFQQILWNKASNKNYVSNPGKGSVHNRGGAVDITIVDKNGKELNMGTAYDFFGKEAHHAYKNFPEEVLENRNLLASMMISAGFSPIPREWWHYSYKRKSFTLRSSSFDCKEGGMLR